MTNIPTPLPTITPLPGEIDLSTLNESLAFLDRLDARTEPSGGSAFGEGMIAFQIWLDTSTRNHEIFVMNADGSDLVRLTDNPAWDEAPAWSPDGQQIAFHAGAVVGCEPAPAPEVTLQAALPIPTPEPTFTVIAQPAVTVLPPIPQPRATARPDTAEGGATPPPAATEAAEGSPVREAPQPAAGSDVTPQVVLVLDVSRSMGSLVLPQELPANLAELRAKIEQVENDPEYLRLSQELNAILADPRVETAFQAWSEASVALDTWLSENGYGQSQFAISDEVALLLADYGCDATYDAFIAYSSGGLPDLDEKLDAACPKWLALLSARRPAINTCTCAQVQV